MIPRELRADPRLVFASGARPIRLSWGSARVMAVPGEGGIAVIVPKKAAKLSVDRHRAKRRVSAALLATRKPGFLVVVTLMTPGTRVRGARLRAWCDELWGRILEGTHA